MKHSHLIIGLICSVLLTGCGGGSSNSSTTSPPVTQPQPGPVTYPVGGTITGLNGEATLTAGTQTLVVTESGEFTFPKNFASGSSITFEVVNSPFTQTCSVPDTGKRTVTKAVTDLAVTCAPLGILTGRVNNYHTGAGLEGINITVTSHDADANEQMRAVAVTDASGDFTVDGLGISDRFVINAYGTGYASRTEIFKNSEAEPNVNHSTLVLTSDYSEAFVATQPATLAVNGRTMVELPANAFVDAEGNLVTGNILPSLTIIDASSDATVMPGNYETRDENGTVNLIESFGAIDASFRDADGNRLQLAPGVSATISIPLASRILPAAAPATVPLFYFDEQTGYWIVEGEARLVSTPQGFVYRGTVDHFTTWNADVMYVSVNVLGCVRDANGNALSNARVTATGRDYIGQSVAYTNSEGNFSVRARPASSILLTSISGSQGDTVIVETGTEESTVDECLRLSQGSATITLTWGQNPSDLDSHWFGPTANGGEFELYFFNRTVEVEGTVFDLDVDDVSSFGPEVVTVPDFPLPGTYRYVVKRYAGTSTILASPARVELNLNGVVHVYSPTNATGPVTSHWHVFNIIVDTAGTPTVVPVQVFSNDKSNPNLSMLAPLNTNIRETTGMSRAQKTERKNYAK